MGGEGRLTENGWWKWRGRGVGMRAGDGGLGKIVNGREREGRRTK